MAVASDPKKCWSCLNALTADTVVELSPGLRLPCCRDCWSEIPVSVRLSIGREAVKSPHDVEAAKAVKAGWEQVAEFFRAAQAGELQRLSPFDIGENWQN